MTGASSPRQRLTVVGNRIVTVEGQYGDGGVVVATAISPGWALHLAAISNEANGYEEE